MAFFRAHAVVSASTFTARWLAACAAASTVTLAAALAVTGVSPADAQPAPAKKPKAAPASAPEAKQPNPAPGPATVPTPPPAPGAAAGTTPSAAPSAGGKVVEMEEDPPPADPTGVEENPGAPTWGDEPELAPEPTAPAKVERGYPIEEVLRPITLPALVSEVGFDLRTRFSPATFDFNLRGRFGITSRWQVGLGYNIGGLYDDSFGVGESRFRFNTGKALSLDLTYRITDWVGARAAVPMYMDPFSIGVALGAPLKFTFANRFALMGLGDLVSFKIHNFLPQVQFEKNNEVFAVDTNRNSITPRGSLRFVAVGVYQWKARTAILATFGTEFADFSNIDVQYPLKAGIQHSVGRSVDLGATLGWETLADPVDSLGVALTAQLRI